MAKPQMQYPLPAKREPAKAEPINVEPIKAEPATQTLSKTVKVYAKYGRFVDLVKDVTILSEPVEVELHGWLQAQIDAGLLIKA